MNRSNGYGFKEPKLRSGRSGTVNDDIGANSTEIAIGQPTVPGS